MTDKHLTDQSIFANTSPAYIDAKYEEYKKSPESVSTDWQLFFRGYDFFVKNSMQSVAKKTTESVLDSREANISKYIHAFRARGHLIADLNPIYQHNIVSEEQFTLQHFGLKESDLNEVFSIGKEIKLGDASLKEIQQRLQEIYCSKIGYEFMNCRNEKLRHWLLGEIEGKELGSFFNADEKKKILEMTIKATLLEDFLHTKYVGQKRFSLEGCDSLIPALSLLVEAGAKQGVEEFVFGMAHRGRLNVLVNVMKKSHNNLFTEFEGGVLPDHIKGDGDVKYHLGQSNDVMVGGKKVHLSLAFNPSHLEAVNPVVEGMVQAKTKKYYGNNFQKIIPVIIHGDAAVAGQGIVYELANLSKIRHYDNGGTLHIILDNQIGFTAVSKETRSGIYSSDIAKITDSPVFHVNADSPEAVCFAVNLALRIRQQFSIDVWVNIIGFRKRGHNEGDDPSFTQPKMYEIVRKHPNVMDLYAKQLQAQNIINEAEFKKLKELDRSQLEESLDTARTTKSQIEVDSLKRYWQNIRPSTAEDFEYSTSTGITLKTCDALLETILRVPKEFNLYPKMQKILNARRKLYKTGNVDWALAEQLGFASLLNEGRSVRLAGQDSERGTFAHRHAVWRDLKTEERYKSLEACAKKPAKFYVINSQLSEYSILGYEYGYSLSRPHALVIWEAQFGDFANGAQIIIDQFISSGETKWQRHSGIVLLLPHGYEGMGPEHSSARLERFLQLCAHENMYVLNMTSPANLFHALRRQIHSPFRKPLIVMSPKSLLRHPRVLSPIAKITDPKGRFEEIIDDETVKLEKVKRVILCSGKVYFNLDDYRIENEIRDTAIVRLEQIYPFSFTKLEALKERYKTVKDWRWVQEEPANMGAWRHIRAHIGQIFHLRHVSRKASASPAEGIAKIHAENQARLMKAAFSRLPNDETPAFKEARLERVGSNSKEKELKK